MAQPFTQFRHVRYHTPFSAVLLLAFLLAAFGCAGTNPPSFPDRAGGGPPGVQPGAGGAPAASEAGMAVESASARKAPSARINRADPSNPAPAPAVQGSGDPSIALPEVASVSPDTDRSQGSTVPGPGLLTFDRAVREALAASPELEQIEHRVRAASEQVRQAEASFYPRIVLSEEFNRTDNPVFALMSIVNQRRFKPTIDFNNPGVEQNFSSKVQGEWVIFEGGTRWYERKAAQGVKHSVENDLRAARNDLVAKVAETYYRWLNALEYIGVAEKALESARTDERLGEARLRAETALPSELLRLKVRTAEARDNKVRARTGAGRFHAALERLLARSIDPAEIPDSTATVAGATLVRATLVRDMTGSGDATTGPPSPPPGEPGAEIPAGRVKDDLVRKALERRPEMAAVKSLVDAANQRVKSAQGGFLPRLGTNLSTQSDSEKLDGTSGESWMVGLQASWPIFEGGITLARTREARARLREVEARGRQLGLDIALEVNQAALTLRDAVERVQVAEERVMWARQALEEVRNLYRNEVVAVDALLQAEVAWQQAEVSRAGAVFEERIAQALLRQSLGDFADGILAEPL